MNETTLRHDESKVKLRAAQKWDDGIPLTLTEIAARYHEPRPTVVSRFRDAEPAGRLGNALTYDAETIRRVMGGAA